MIEYDWALPVFHAYPGEIMLRQGGQTRCDIIHRIWRGRTSLVVLPRIYSREAKSLPQITLGKIERHRDKQTMLQRISLTCGRVGRVSSYVSQFPRARTVHNKRSIALKPSQFADVGKASQRVIDARIVQART